MVAAGPGPSGDADAVAVPAVKGGGCGGGGGGGDVTRPLALLLGGAAGGAPARVVEVASRRTGHALVAHYRGGVVLALGGAVGAPSGSQGAGTAAVEAAEVAQLDPCASGGEAGDCAAAWALPEVAVVDSSGRQHLAGEVARDVLQPREGHVSVCPTGAHGTGAGAARAAAAATRLASSWKRLQGSGCARCGSTRSSQCGAVTGRRCYRPEGLSAEVCAKLAGHDHRGGTALRASSASRRSELAWRRALGLGGPSTSV